MSDNRPPEVRGGSEPPTPALPPEARDEAEQPDKTISQDVRYGYAPPDGEVDVSAVNAPRVDGGGPLRPFGMRNWGAALAFVVLLGLIAWGVQQQRQLRLVQARAENAYRRAFHQLIVHTEAIADNLDRIVVSAGRPLQLYGLEELRTQTSAANASFGALPVGVLPLQQTKGYLAHLNDWSRELSLRLQEGGSLTSAEYEQLLTLRQQAHSLVQHLTDLRDLQAAGQLNWSSMEQFLGPAFSGQASGPLVDGITRLDSIFTTPRNESAAPRVSPGSGLGLSGPPVDLAEAEREARRYISEKDGESLTFVGEVQGEINSYRFDATAKDGRSVRVDVARNGGQVTWMLADRPVGKPELTKAEAIAAAEQYLAERGYGDMVYSSYEDYGPSNVALITLVWRQGDVLVYPDTIRVRVALDNGEVLGVNAMPYLTFHRPRDIPPAAISLDSALTRIPPHLHVLAANPAIVEDELGNEVFTYEVRVQFEGDVYQVFYNANTGDEVRVSRLIGEL